MKRTLMSRFLTCFSICLLSLAALASVANAGPPRVLLGTADPFAILAGSNITNTGPSVINGDVGLHPGTSVTGFPPGTVNGAQHITDAVALKAKSDLVAAYNDAAGRPLSATTSPDLGGQSLKAGVYRTGSVPALGLTGNLTLDAEGDPNAVFIFQIASTLVTATDSSVSLINGAQACNVYWQVGSSATLGTRTAFKGNILALTSISVLDSAVIQGRLLARNGAVTLINDTINRAQCAPGTDGSEGGGPGDGSGGGPGHRARQRPRWRHVGSEDANQAARLPPAEVRAARTAHPGPARGLHLAQFQGEREAQRPRRDQAGEGLHRRQAGQADQAHAVLAADRRPRTASRFTPHRGGGVRPRGQPFGVEGALRPLRSPGAGSALHGLSRSQR